MSLAIINQEVGDLMNPLVKAGIQDFGSVNLLCGRSTLPLMSGLQVHAGPQFQNASARSRIVSWVKFARWAQGEALSLPPRTPLLLTSNPPLWPKIVRRYRRVNGGPVTLLLWDTYPEAVERFAGLSPKSPVSRAWRRMNRAGLTHADAIVTISQDMADLWSQYRATPSAGMHVIPTWVECDRIKPIPREENEIRRELGWGDRLVVLYSGNLGTVHDVTILPEVADRLRSRTDILFAVAGSGAYRQRMEADVASRRLDNFQFVPYQSADRLPTFLAAADVSVVSLAAGAEGVSMPSKAYYGMAAGSALLTINVQGHDLDRLITETGGGCNVPPHRADLAAEAILRFADDADHLASCRQLARSAALTQFDASIVVPALLDVVRSTVREA